jgi:protein arginine kinase activator
MVCEHCKKNPATVVVTTVVDDEKTIQHLCRDCAVELGIDLSDEKTPIKEAVAVMKQADESLHDEEKHDIACDACGLTYTQFQERYRLGCSLCYESFREQLVPLLRKVHGNDTHTGKKPTMGDAPKTVENPEWALEALKRRLYAAVEREEFEEAARLRDQISELGAKRDEESDQA